MDQKEAEIIQLIQKSIKIPTKFSKIEGGENFSCLVEIEEIKYYLRIYKPLKHTKELITNEIKLLYYLANYFKEENEIIVPIPKCISNLSIVNDILLDNGQTLFWSIFSWIDGQTLTTKLINKDTLFLVSKSMGEVCHAMKSFTINMSRPRWNFNKLFYLNLERIFSSEIVSSQTKNTLINTKFTIEKYVTIEILKEFEMGNIHADIHFGNLILADNKLAIIDFDDFGVGYYAYECANFLLDLWFSELSPELLNCFISQFCRFAQINRISICQIYLLSIFRCIYIICFIIDYIEKGREDSKEVYFYIDLYTEKIKYFEHLLFS